MSKWIGLSTPSKISRKAPVDFGGFPNHKLFAGRLPILSWASCTCTVFARLAGRADVDQCPPGNVTKSACNLVLASTLRAAELTLIRDDSFADLEYCSHSRSSWSLRHRALRFLIFSTLQLHRVPYLVLIDLSQSPRAVGSWTILVGTNSTTSRIRSAPFIQYLFSSCTL